MEHLKIINFGAIKEADIEIKKYNIFIGDTSSGKSTAAKLIAIFNSVVFFAIKNGDFKSFTTLLEKYNINFNFESSTVIEYQDEKYHWEITKDKFISNYNDDDAELMKLANEAKPLDFIQKFKEKKEIPQILTPIVNLIINQQFSDNYIDSIYLDIVKPNLLKSIYDKYSPIYIPAERLLISTFTNSIFSILQLGGTIPFCIKDFGSLYENAREKNRNIDIDVLNIKISFEKTGDKVLLKSDNKKIMFSQSSSGIQTIMPLWIVFNHYIDDSKGRLFIVEEPELNLFPTTQVSLVEWMMKKMRKSDSKIVITTHSPYILSTLDNLIYANEISRNRKGIDTKLAKLLPSMALVDFNEVSSHYFAADGVVKDIIDSENKSVGAEYIDEASNSSSKLFNDLWDLENNEL